MGEIIKTYEELNIVQKENVKHQLKTLREHELDRELKDSEIDFELLEEMTFITWEDNEELADVLL